MKINELVRRKECFGEDPAIFIRTKELNKREIELCEQFGVLKNRELGTFIKRNQLIPESTLIYVNEGYDGNYTGYYFPSTKRADGYEIILLHLSSFHKSVDQNEIQNLATLVAQDLEIVTGGDLSEKIENIQGKICEPNCKNTDRRYSHILSFCGVSLSFKEECKDMYAVIRAYTSNLTEGIKHL